MANNNNNNNNLKLDKMLTGPLEPKSHEKC